MRNILLIGINARYSHPAVALYYLKTYVADIPSNCRIVEYTIRNNPEEIAESIWRQKPDAVGMSVYIWNSHVMKRLIELLSVNKEFFIFLGGPEVSYNAEEWLKKYPAVDCIITGHGEEGFRRLMENSFILKDNIIQSHNPPFKEIPFPYMENDFSGFTNKNVYYESSRGCPFSCAYCVSSCRDQKLEFRELSQVSDEIEKIMRHSPKLVKFIDRTFNANAERARRIWEMLIERYSETKTTFHFEVHPALLSEGDFEVLKKTPKGLFQFEIGVQTTHQHVRREIGRKGNWEKEKWAVEKLKAMNNIPLHVDLIAGLPGENFDMFGKSFDRIYALGAGHLQLGILKILPGTAIRQKSEEYHMCYDECAPYAINRNQWLSEEEVRRLKIIARLVDALHNSKKFTVTMNELSARFYSPWEFYCTLAENTREDLRDISWERMYRVLIHFCEKLFTHEIAFLCDCLAYDWFSNFRTNRVPAFLKSEKYHEIKKKALEIIKTNSAYMVHNHGIKQIKLFVPETEEFKIRYLEGFSAVAFLPEEKRLLIESEKFF